MNFLRNAIVLALLIFSTGMVQAQEYGFRYLGASEGLTNLTIREIYQDRTGFIWVSTENGIFRFDGERFEEFGPNQGIPSSSAAGLGEAPDGTLLVGGKFGLYNLHGNHFEKLNVAFKSVSWAQGIQADGKGHTYIGTDCGLVVLSIAVHNDGFEARVIPQPAQVRGTGAFGVLVDGDTVWYGCGLELCRRDSKSTTIFGKDSGLPERSTLPIRKDHGGNLWVWERKLGAFELQVGKAKFRRPDLPIPVDALGGIAGTDEEGRILLPSAEGLLLRDKDGWQKIDRSNGLRGTVYSVLEDRQHSLWIGLAGRGLAQWRGYGDWTSYTTASGLGSDLVYEMLPRADGSLLVGTEGGMFRGQRRGFAMAWTKVASLGSSAVHSVQAAPNGDVWVGTEAHGAARMRSLDGRVTWFDEKQGLSAKDAYTLRFDRLHRLWVTTEAGLFVSTPPYERFSRITELPANRFWAVAEASDGTIWAGGDGGLFDCVNGVWKNLPADGMSNKEVSALGAGADGIMWVGYRLGGGIDRLQPSASGMKIDKGINRPGTTGLIYFLDFDAQGRLWAGTERGVDTWDGTRWDHYDIRDGLSWDDCDLHGFAAEANGTVWIGTSGGLSSFKSHPRNSLEMPPEVVFTHLITGRTDVSGLSNPHFGASSNSLTAQYATPGAQKQTAVLFRYRLNDAQAWTETTERKLQFAQLSAGGYRLQVEAKDGDRDWKGNRAEFPFVILPPWYLSWWFFCICVLIPCSGIATMIRLRMARAKNRERELVRIVDEKTHELLKANQELQRLSSTDTLTGLANRRLFNLKLEEECARMTRTTSPVSLLMLDVDHFKALNDSQGHQQGDKYLAFVAVELMRLAKRQTDLAARYGGEEFAVILADTSAESAEQLAESARLAIETLQLPHLASSVAPFLTVSIGIATATIGGWMTPDALVDAADKALYTAKRSGRNRVVAATGEAILAEKINLELSH
jgi:diguanylate cyclase (GGDEF)-like protein